MLPRIVIWLTLTMMASSVFSQAVTSPTGSWLMFFTQSRFSQKWGLHSEMQYRSYEVGKNTDQVLLRGGINYHFNNSSFTTVGYAHISNFAFNKEMGEGPQMTENRLWQQFLLRNNVGRFHLEHRFRLEQRWLNSESNSQYLNRFRFMLRATIPLNKKKIEKNTLFLTFYDELFVNFSDNPFDRNRLYGAIGYQFIPNLNIQLGFLVQSTNQETRQLLQAGISYNIDFRQGV